MSRPPLRRINEGPPNRVPGSGVVQSGDGVAILHMDDLAQRCLACTSNTMHGARAMGADLNFILMGDFFLA
ncbi:hypothetical protein CBP36_12165 [Acidovorax carolinensis]|uniref:Uncharacterized protein n=1 Tax=Acidovorax carolinensis TaxID=553814 RepID=A0A240UDB9_9BURK|nr:hypothetical protein [Acidovorax carolinensis]ART59494.1 hypothetical protein CBP36_12165 [Acidovorax carolinensis]